MSLVGGNPLCERLTGNALSAQVNPCHISYLELRTICTVYTHDNLLFLEGCKNALGFDYGDGVVSNVCDPSDHSTLVHIEPAEGRGGLQPE